jgi:hypothetical protein
MMVRYVEAIVAKASGIVSDLGQLVPELQLAAGNVKNLSQGINALTAVCRDCCTERT